MDKEVKLIDYKDNEHRFVIEDFENVSELIFEILSGDGVLTVVYSNGKRVEFDSSNDRLMDFHDGMWILQPKDIDVINQMKSHYDTDKLDEAEESYGD